MATFMEKIKAAVMTITDSSTESYINLLAGKNVCINGEKKITTLIRS